MDVVNHSLQDAAGSEELVLFDVTRLVALHWTGRRANGIDRICLAYLRHFAPRALAVLQHRGVIRVLSRAASHRLFVLLAGDRCRGVRRRLVLHLAGALTRLHQPRPNGFYLNVSHTDYDLPAHVRWIERHGLRAIYLVHDLIPILHPDHCRPAAVKRHTGRVASALRHGAGIIVGSAAVARDLHTHAARQRLPSPPIAVAPLAGAALPRDAPPRADTDYFLCVGTIESRKNHDLLRKVWEQMRATAGNTPPQLVIVGQWGTGVTVLRKALVASQMVGGLIEIVEDCDDDALASLMLGARAVLMPSLAEGFGLPMAEALALGVPVIASDLPCFREVGQGIPCLLDPHDVSGWKAKIVAFDRAASRRQRRIDALRGYRPPTWDNHFEQVDRWMATITRTPVADLRTGTGRATPARRHIDLGTAN
jgi:glycosyltransferase involved in cell wall biosynthesis